MPVWIFQWIDNCHIVENLFVSCPTVWIIKTKNIWKRIQMINLGWRSNRNGSALKNKTDMGDHVTWESFNFLCHQILLKKRKALVSLTHFRKVGLRWFSFYALFDQVSLDQNESNLDKIPWGTNTTKTRGEKKANRVKRGKTRTTKSWLVLARYCNLDNLLILVLHLNGWEGGGEFLPMGFLRFFFTVRHTLNESK